MSRARIGKRLKRDISISSFDKLAGCMEKIDRVIAQKAVVKIETERRRIS